MTKKRVTTTLFIALVVLTLISCCFLGSTFARYVSGGKGAASVSVADWAIDFGVEGSDVGGTTTVTFSDLSPAQEAYDGTNPRVNSSKLTLLATITNSGDVAASVTLAIGEDVTVTHETAAGGETDPKKYGDADIAELFDLELYAHTSELTTAEEKYAWDGSAKTLAASGTLYVYGVVTWTSDDTASDDMDCSAADAKDTYVGEWIDSIGWTLTYTAVQASELPGATA